MSSTMSHGRVPSAREVRKQKEKWEAKPNDKKIRSDYFLMLSRSGRFIEIEKLLSELLEEKKGNNIFSSWAFTTAASSFDKIDLKVVEAAVDNYLLCNVGKLKPLMDTQILKPKFLNIVRKRAEELSISLTDEEEELEIFEPECDEIVVETPEEILIKTVSAKNQDAVERFYSLFKIESKPEWYVNKNLIKAIFKAAKNMRRYDDRKAQELLDFCIKAFPDNGNYLSTNLKWNPKEEEDSTSEEEGVISIVKDEKIIKIIPLEKQIYTQEEIFKELPGLGTIFGDTKLSDLISSDPTKFRKDRKWGSILISIGGIFLDSLDKPEEADLVWEILDKMTMNSELRAKEIKASNILKYNILVALKDFDAAEEWSEENGLDLEPEEINDGAIEVNETIAKQESAESLFFDVVKHEAIKHYRKRVDFYINNGQFKHKLGEEVSDVVIENLKNKIAVDLKYLDMEIRELLIPYFIKVESNARVVLKTDEPHRQTIGEVIDKAYHDYSGDMKFIMDVSKIKSKDYSDEELFQQFILAFRAIRNHMAHGNLNLFGLKLYKPTKTLTVDFDYESAISLYEESGDASLDAILSTVKKKEGSLELFSLPIVERVLSYDAIENKRAFGIGIIILYMTVPRYTFLKIASEIDHKIHTFRNRTVLGSNTKLYDSLGLKPDWLIEITKLEEE